MYVHVRMHVRQEVPVEHLSQLLSALFFWGIGLSWSLELTNSPIQLGCEPQESTISAFVCGFWVPKLVQHTLY